MALVAGACGGAQEASQAPALEKNTDGYTDVGAAQVDEILADPSVTVVDVHIPYEGEIPGTDLVVPYNDIDALVAQLPDKSSPILLYCRSGNMSTEAASALVDRGYTNLMELDGGYNAWVQQGGELVQR
jgi:rhodanese-related sulfurtransferase